MKKTLYLLLLLMALPLTGRAELTLDYCLERAEENYPLIHKYGLIEKTAAINLSDINKGWLPRISVYAQGTAQNAVPAFPESMENLLSQIGQEMKGLGKIQYKAGVDVTQTVWDGGASASRRKVERASAEASASSVAVGIYAVREQVINLYFGILLMDEQIAQTENTIALLAANHRKLLSMLANGTAMQSDADMVEAQMLTMKQQLTQARNSVKGYRKMLALYIGEDTGDSPLRRPAAGMPSDFSPARPELAMYEAQTRLNTAREEAVNATVRPRVGFFAQAYYGYPGMNYFESMVNRRLSFNILAGLRLSWDIDSFYTKKNSRRRLALASADIENDRELFLFNTRLHTSSQTEAIDGLKEVIKEDACIVRLRADVRKAAESQLANGIIDTTALLGKITDENQARITAACHELQLLQEIYQLKHTLNR